MSWQDREYARRDVGGWGRGGGAATALSGFGRGSVVTVLIVANVVVFMLQSQAVLAWGLLIPQRVVAHGEVWRLVTATFLHADFPHIFFNMFGLYMFGRLVESRWGARATLGLYLICGVLANVVLTASAYVGFLPIRASALGASGCVLAVLGAAAVLFPHEVFLVMGVIPARLRTLALVYGAGYVYNVVNQGSNYGGDLCHLVGLVGGAWWAWRGRSWWDIRRRAAFFGRGQGVDGSQPGRREARGSFRERVRQREVDQQAVDRILKKVHDYGVHSLTEAEKRTLLQATERLQAADRGVRGAERLP
ncbi:MAG: rhomboid family intramembrane serine protease [Phycisphaerales bacterium]|nr:MAG: rhomboid family intramembrane serine protease [Phycisphaerales bacterium]